MPHRPHHRWMTRASGLAFVAAALAAGCSSPIGPMSEAELKRGVMDGMRRELAEASLYADTIRLSRESRTGELDITDRSREEIDGAYNPERYFLGEDRSVRDAGGALDQVDGLLGPDLYGEDTRAVAVGLRRAVAAAVANNLDVQVARLEPAISQSLLTAAESVFDWTFFGSVTWTDNDTPGSGPGFLGLDAVITADQTVAGETGLRRQLTSGGLFEISQSLSYTDIRDSGFGALPTPNPASSAAINLVFEQPLLRGFGSDVNLAEVRLSRNAERRSVASLNAELQDAVTETERAYWNLVSAHRELVISAKLLERGERVREEVRGRLAVDAVQAQVADAVATVESRRADVLQARNTLRRASDALKALMNDPELPVGSELLLVPEDSAVDEPIAYSLVDAIQTALDERPEVDAAVLDIDDASINELVADNGRLPVLDLRAEASLLGFDENPREAAGDVYNTEFIDSFILGAIFERPIGNRGPEAEFRQRRLERIRSVAAFRRTVQAVTLEVKNALNDVALNYELIEQARTSRIAAAEALRTLLVEKELTRGGFSVERLDLEFSQQDALAAAERLEVQAVIDYNVAIADLARAMGTALRRNRIDFVVPDINQQLEGEAAIDYLVEEPASGRGGAGSS